MKYRHIITSILSTLFLSPVLADEGMWVPLFINKNIADMQANGCKLSAEDIYSVNKTSLKDAVLIFDGGCTGELVSNEGLILTNHHCGYNAIQSLSSIEHNYLANGFWAENKAAELPCYGVSVKQLVRIDDVTADVLKDTENQTNASYRQATIGRNIKDLCKTLESGSSNVSVDIEPFLGGDQYLAYTYKVFKDVRLVGTPPSNLGKFGGDTDNWAWPRHTCDFSIFRVYADKNNEPAEFSTDNVPYHPATHLRVSTKGVKENDFVMVMGYPGSTDIYNTASYVEMYTQEILPPKIELRTAKLNVMNHFQSLDERINIQYASKNASVSNAWKKWQGEIRGVRRSQAVRKKREREDSLQFSLKELQELEELNKLYTDRSERSYAKFEATYGVLLEVLRNGGVELFRVSNWVNIISNGNDDYIQRAINYLTNTFYPDHNVDVDREMSKQVLMVMRKYVPAELLPKWCQNDNSICKSIDKMFKNSVFTDSAKTLSLIRQGKISTLTKDIAYTYYDELYNIISKELYNYFSPKLSQSKIMEMSNDIARATIKATSTSDQPRMSDANFTQRISYGKVLGYEGSDAVVYRYYTTLDGLVQKLDAGAYDYVAPDTIRIMCKNNDFGPYADPSDGRLHTCFVATCHTTGGNSGSPVLNADGELVGLNFDRAWDGVMSDYFYDPAICRNISLDIRYLLFVVDKLGGAKWIAQEIIN
ncbi:MAG: S46 family peptidase [Bacteroidales bacterium]|nr:S46 family peptidase [Bacteroidales bacterium]